MPHFILRTKTFDAPWLANLFVKGAVRLHGMPKTIIYDRDVKFVSYFWKTLWAKLGTKIKYSRAFHDFHPQTDSKTFLHGTLSFHKPSFAYNSLANRSIGHTPFEVAMGLKPRQPIDLVTLPLPVRCSEQDKDFARHIQDIHVDIQHRVATNNAQYKTPVDAHQRHVEFQVGEFVMVHLKPNCFPRGTYQKMHSRNAVSFQVLG